MPPPSPPTRRSSDPTPSSKRRSWDMTSTGTTYPDVPGSRATPTQRLGVGASNAVSSATAQPCHTTGRPQARSENSRIPLPLARRCERPRPRGVTTSGGSHQADVAPRTKDTPMAITPDRAAMVPTARPDPRRAADRPSQDHGPWTAHSRLPHPAASGNRAGIAGQRHCDGRCNEPRTGVRDQFVGPVGFEPTLAGT
jgi:hypothetical protein